MDANSDESFHSNRFFPLFLRRGVLADDDDEEYLFHSAAAGGNRFADEHYSAATIERKDAEEYERIGGGGMHSNMARNCMKLAHSKN